MTEARDARVFRFWNGAVTLVHVPKRKPSSSYYDPAGTVQLTVEQTARLRTSDLRELGEFLIKSADAVDGTEDGGPSLDNS